MKSAGVYRASTDLQKCGFDERKFSGRQWRLVKLQRPPPEMSIFLPMRSAHSSTATRRPRRPAERAQSSPAAPPPNTIASKDCFTLQVCGAQLQATSPKHWTGEPQSRRLTARLVRACVE